MTFMAVFLSIFLVIPVLGAERALERNKLKPSQNKLICKTGPEKRALGQPLKLYLNFNLPIVFEAEDPTVPFGRQTMLLAGRPVVQLFFEKATGPAGDNGENLQPMQCAFARRGIKGSEPALVQILLQPNQVTWLSQGIGQRGAAAERAVIQPAGDWGFAYQHEQIFVLELDDRKGFITSQMPKAL